MTEILELTKDAKDCMIDICNNQNQQDTFSFILYTDNLNITSSCECGEFFNVL